MSDDFNVDRLHELIDRALHDEVVPEREGVATPASLPFAMGNSRLFEALDQVLTHHTTDDVTQAVLSELRDVAYEGLDGGSLRELHTVVRHCRRCPAMVPEPQLPLGNVANPDVVFIHELAPRDNEFHRELTACLSDVGFDPARVCHTSLVRCTGSGQVAPSTSEVERCVTSYLFTELQLLRPRLIMTLGAPATSALLGGASSLNEDRGRLFWLGPWAILPTFAWGYLHRRPEARDSFTADLQRGINFCYGTPS